MEGYIMLEGASRLVRALIIALGFRVSLKYAYAVLVIMDKLDGGQMTETEFLRAGAHLGEMFPEDYRRAKSLFIKEEGQP
jgi:hypothetical protein